jgi:hypothetical protein
MYQQARAAVHRGGQSLYQLPAAQTPHRLRARRAHDRYA